MASVTYNNGKGAILKSQMDSVTLKAMFMNTSYSPNIDSHVYVSDISASRASGTSDVTLSSVTVTVDNTNDIAKLSCSSISSGTVTATTNAYVVYISTGVDSTSQLICYVELTDGVTTPKTFLTVAGTITVSIPSTGFLKLT